MKPVDRFDTLQRRLEKMADELGVSFFEMGLACSQRPLITKPGKLVEGESPLPLGSRVNLRRETIPGRELDPRDADWVVLGYLQKPNGRWAGYDLRQGKWGLQVTTMSNVAAFDLIERGPDVSNG